MENPLQFCRNIIWLLKIMLNTFEEYFPASSPDKNTKDYWCGRQYELYNKENLYYGNEYSRWGSFAS